jgi:hypothetical protein
MAGPVAMSDAELDKVSAGDGYGVLTSDGDKGLGQGDTMGTNWGGHVPFEGAGQSGVSPGRGNDTATCAQTGTLC